jgi:hypothetical protein
MGQEFYVQLAASGFAVAALVALAAWAKIARPVAPLDEERARFLLLEEFPGRSLDAVWVGVNGRGAVAKSGAAALVLCEFGDGYVARQIPWAMALSASFRKGELCIDLADISAPMAVISLPSWPPKNLTKDIAA